MNDTSTQTKFKHKLASVIADLQSTGTRDSDAMWILGSVAASLVDGSKAKTWKTYRQALNGERDAALRNEIYEHGNKLLADNRPKAAYALQALGLSVVAQTMTDPQIAEGTDLLDGVIEHAIGFYRKTPAPKQS